MLFKSKPQRLRSAKEDCSTDTNASTGTGEPYVIEKFLNASSAVTTFFLEATDDDDSSASYSTSSYISEANSDDPTNVINRFLDDIFTEADNDASSGVSLTNCGPSQPYAEKKLLNNLLTTLTNQNS